MLSVFEGFMGSGKTLLTVIIAFLSSKNKNKKIICNFHLKGINYELLDINKFLRQEYENALIIIDEAYVYFESRTSMSIANRLSSYILFQSRKKGIEIILTFQLLRTIDVRFRELIDIYVNCNKTLNGFKYTYYNFHTKIISENLLSFENASKFYQYYDTYEVIQDKKMKIDIQSQKEKNKIIEDYAKYILKHNDKITLNTVKLFCFKNEINKSLIQIIYAQVKELQKECQD